MVASLWLEEELIRIRTVNRRMAHGARLILLGLIVESGSRGRPGIGGKCVALQAEQVHLGALEKPRVGIAMRRMARDAALGFDRRVFVNEGSGFVAMAFEAGRVLRTRGTQLPELEAAMGIVTVVALNHAFIHAVMKSSRELLFNLQVAAVAELWPLVLHQELTLSRVVWAMAIRATDIVL
jgi:hypothetical protein